MFTKNRETMYAIQEMVETCKGFTWVLIDQTSTYKYAKELKRDYDIKSDNLVRIVKETQQVMEDIKQCT